MISGGFVFYTREERFSFLRFLLPLEFCSKVFLSGKVCSLSSLSSLRHRIVLKILVCSYEVLWWLDWVLAHLWLGDD
jgi:hypothetical protein